MISPTLGAFPVGRPSAPSAEPFLTQLNEQIHSSPQRLRSAETGQDLYARASSQIQGMDSWLRATAAPLAELSAPAATADAPTLSFSSPRSDAPPTVSAETSIRAMLELSEQRMEQIAGNQTTPGIASLTRAPSDANAAPQTTPGAAVDMTASGSAPGEFRAVASLTFSIEAVSLGRSIDPADFATEKPELTRTEILQQAGISTLSQANSLR